METGRLSASELSRFLNEWEVKNKGQEDSVDLEGFLKQENVKRDQEEESLDFAPYGDCSLWISLPSSCIKHAEFIAQLPCRDHGHPYFRLRLAAPPEPWASLVAAIRRRIEHQLAFSGTVQKSPDSSMLAIKPITIPESILRPSTLLSDTGSSDSGDGPSGTLNAVDIWQVNALNYPTLDCRFHPDGYCLLSARVAYLGPTLIACEPPFAYVRYTRKGSCT